MINKGASSPRFRWFEEIGIEDVPLVGGSHTSQVDPMVSNGCPTNEDRDWSYARVRANLSGSTHIYWCRSSLDTSRDSAEARPEVHAWR